jgi:hypothetical protein
VTGLALFPKGPRRTRPLANSVFGAATSNDAAALAGIGQGNEASQLTDKHQAGLRQQAHDWLRTELAAWAKSSDHALVQRTLMHWQKDTDLAGLSDKEALAKLLPTEREAWQKLWADVADLLEKTAGKK